MNQRKILVTINGYTKPLRQWADEYDIDYKAMHGESRKYRRPWVYRTKPRTLWVYVGT